MLARYKYGVLVFLYGRSGQSAVGVRILGVHHIKEVKGLSRLIESLDMKEKAVLVQEI